MKSRRFVRAAGTGAAMMLAACATDKPEQSEISIPAPPSTGAQTAIAYDDFGEGAIAAAPGAFSPGNIRLAPHVVPTSRFLQCVPYARSKSGLPIYGNAATWWRSAHGVYRQNNQPVPGAVMVFRSSRRNPYGHLAVVRTVLSDRKVVVDHANWLNQGRIHRGTPVVDVSRANDWSAVRVWYTPGNRLGAHIFPVIGFIHRDKIPPGELFRTVANANVRQKPSRKARRVARLPKLTTVEVLERVAGRPWFRIGRDGREIGYVFAPLIEPMFSGDQAPGAEI